MRSNTETQQAIGSFNIRDRGYPANNTGNFYEKYADLNDDLKSDPLVAIAALIASKNAAYTNNRYFDDIIPFFREHLPDTLKNSQEFILSALNVHSGALKFASESVLRENVYHIALVAINLNRHHPRGGFTDIPRSFFLEKSFISTVLKKYPQHSKYMNKINPAAVDSLKCERNLSATCKYMWQMYTFFDRLTPAVDDSLEQMVMKMVMGTTQ